MVTNISRGITILESSAADNQNWLHTPGDIDLDNFTEGTDYVALPYNTRISHKTDAEFNIEHVPGSRAWPLALDERVTVLEVEAVVLGEAAANKLTSFFDSHTNITDEEIYLVYYRQDTTYKTFLDHNRTSRSYAKGVVTSYKIDELPDEVSHQVKLVFEVTWN